MRTVNENEGVTKAELARAINELIRNLEIVIPGISDRCGKQEPAEIFKQKRTLAYADGVNWDPGSGAGWYECSDGTNWVKL